MSTMRGTTPFNPKKSLMEEIEGLRGVRTAVINQQRRAREDFGRAETELYTATKLKGFVDAEIERKTQVLRELEQE